MKFRKLNDSKYELIIEDGTELFGFIQMYFICLEQSDLPYWFNSFLGKLKDILIIGNKDTYAGLFQYGLKKR